AFPQGRCFLDQIVIVTGLRSGNGGLKSATITDAHRATEPRDQSGVCGDHLLDRRIDCHCARRRSSSGCCWMKSSTAARKGDAEGSVFRLRNRMNSRTASCSRGVNESIRSVMLSAAIVLFHFAVYPG